MNELTAVLLECELFNTMNETEIKEMLTKLYYQIRDYKRGDYLMKSDEPYPYISVVIDGIIEIQRPLLSGNNLCIELRESGELFGGSIVFAEEGRPAGCEIIARTAVRLMRLPRSEVSIMLQNYPATAQNLNSLFSSRVLAFQQRLELLSYSSIKQKIAYYCKNILHPDEMGIRRLPLSKAKWAEYMNVSRPSLMRELKNLETENVLFIDENKIIRIDENKIEEYL